MQKNEKKVKKNETAEAILSLVKAVESLEKKVMDKLEKMDTMVYKPQNDTIKIELKKKEPNDVKEPKTDPEVPFPQSYRSVINEVLNAKFEASIKYLDASNFEITIYVPREYSNASPREWDMYKADRRIKVIANYLDAQGVREYVNQVAENLGQEIRAKIADDRAKLSGV